MKPFWYPHSVLLLPDAPPSFAHPAVLRMLLASGDPLELLYAGDRMWPTVRHGQRVTVEAMGTERPTVGAVVLGCPSHIPDLFRIARLSGSTLLVRGDADPHESFSLEPGELLGRARLPIQRVTGSARALRRLWLDLREAWSGEPDTPTDPSGTVRSKYDAQAPFYAGVESGAIFEPLLSILQRRVRPGGRILVAGSGSGRESLELAKQGWSVTGIDFSPAMVSAARRLSRDAGSAASRVEFVLTDLTAHEEPLGSLAGIYFTYDVYSFLSGRAQRIELLKRMARWLEPDGLLLLSARRVGRPYSAFVLTLQRAARGRAPGARWGQSHTLWISTDGKLHRSFVHVFTTAAVRREAALGGFRTESWLGNHCVLTPAAPRRDRQNAGA